MNRYPKRPLAELADVTAGDPAPQRQEDFSPDGVPFVRMQDVGRYGQTTCLTATKDRLSSDASKRLKKFVPGAILIPKSGASIRLNHRAILGVEAHVVSHLAVVTPGPLLKPQFAYYFFCATDLSRLAHDADLPSMKTSVLAKLEIPVPPLQEQERIVKLLDEADALRQLRAQADRRTADLIPGLFHDFCARAGSQQWSKHTLGDSDVMAIIDGDRGVNYPKKTDFSDDGHCLFLNTSNVRKGEFDFAQCDFITQEKDNALRKGKLKRGDVVLTTRGTLGNSAHFHSGIPHEHVRINSGMVVLRANQELLLPEYLLIVLNSEDFASQVDAMTSGSAQPQLPINRLSHITFSLPPLSVQQQFAERVLEVHGLKATQARSAERLANLSQSLLHTVFGGVS